MNPLFQAMSGGGKMQQVAGLMQMLKSGNPQQIAMQMMQTNPQFRQFMEQNKGKDPMQIAREHGIDLNKIMGPLK